MSGNILFHSLLVLPAVVIAIIMVMVVAQAGPGKTVAISTIRCVGLAGIIISVLMILITNRLAGFTLLVASVLYWLSLKNINLAKIGAGLSVVALLLAIVL